MEERKTIFNYIGQIFATYGMIVVIFILFGLFIGDDAKDYSSLFAFGNKGLSFSTLVQLFFLAVITSLGQILFLTDRWIKNMPLLLRNVAFFLLVMATMILFAILFDWFPVTDVKAWIGFFVSFSICTVISVMLSRLEEQTENKKMEEALRKLRSEK